ncbi:hypothetical protein FNO01nite_04550 [Flavobacterium noncentrifugens]|uniref:3-oxoacyl-ACP synthase n=1 Tax=Flavobacterium noncentrifugens TaxID=1128970 RepID=A0A1G8SEI1_9FLAO|nr:hypothetical protein FNO01nite_04550 [Flavobacterium noncentrifugens]SDJ27090.1 hypothetical protein SAMN04487935_0505 [Flavobacterium noncentrifugens]
MEKKTYIQAFCTIENNKIVLNGETVFESENTGFADFSKKAYQHFEIGYPKFFKMDNLSKLAFLGSELLLKAQNPNDENNTALLFANKSSSLDTDVKYQNSISDKENYFPSPAVFVYTLANICLGEISIRHQLKSENSFFIFDAFNAAFMADYANILIETQKAKNVLCGWTEFFGEDYKAFLYLVGNEGAIENTKQNLEILYNK